MVLVQLLSNQLMLMTNSPTSMLFVVIFQQMQLLVLCLIPIEQKITKIFTRVTTTSSMHLSKTEILDFQVWASLTKCHVIGQAINISS
jgi:hypothetical protein